MLIFIDDSGDPGFKFDKGSSTHFVIACVIFDDNLDAEETALKIKRFRRSLGWRDEQEFKFNKASKKIRQAFLNEVKNCNFRIRAIVVNKTSIKNTELRTDKNKFYNYIIKEVLVNNQGTILNASIRLDGHQDRSYKMATLTYFRQQLNQQNRLLKNIRFVDSQKDSLIQLADMVASSIFRTTQNKTDKEEYKTIIREKIENILEFKQ
jgi:hypothetical protein